MVVYGYLLFEQNSLPLQNKVTLIGRSPSCHIVFSHPSISKEHGVIEFSESEGAVLKDLNAMNGIYVNDSRIPKGGQTFLYNNTKITFGKDPIHYTFVFSPEFEKSRAPVSTTSNAFQEKRPPLESEKNVNRDTTINLVDQHARNYDSAHSTKTKDFHPSASQKSFVPERNVKQNETGNLNQQQSTSKLRTQNLAGSNDFNAAPWQKHQLELNEQQLRVPTSQENFYPSPRGQAEHGDRKSNLVHHNEILELNERVLEKEEAVIKKETEIGLYKGEIESLRDECGRIKSKLHAVELYASDLQRKNDLLTQEISERNAIIQELQSNDLGLKAQLNINEVKSLRQILLSKDEEVASLKRQLKAVLQSQSDPSVNTNHYEGFLEQQARELAATKKQLQEYESRAEECKRRWNQLIKENVGKEEKIKGLTFQLNRQIESYQSLYAETDRKIAGLNAKFIALVSEDRETKERQAAEFLVQQMVQIQEEKEKMAFENEQLHMQTQELIDETRRMGEEYQDLQFYFENDRAGGFLDDKSSGVNVGKMKARIEELEDLLYEIKQNEGVRKTSELHDTIGELERKLALQERYNQELKDKLSDVKANAGTIHEQSSIDFFTKLLEEKDQIIVHLKTQNDVLLSKERQYQIEIEHLRENVKQGTLQFENYKQRQSRLESALSTKGGPINSYTAGFPIDRAHPESFGGSIAKFSYE